MRWMLLITVCLLAGAAVSVADPVDSGDDSSGIYFDEGAEIWCADSGVGTQVTAYFCLTRPTRGLVTGIDGWEAAIEISDGASIASFTPRGSWANASTAPDFRVTLDPPLPAALSTVLLEIVINVDVPYNISLKVRPHSSPSWVEGIHALPFYWDDSVGPEPRQSLGYSWGWDPGTGEPNWLASVNDAGCGGGPTRTEASTWGSVKTLYR